MSFTFEAGNFYRKNADIIIAKSHPYINLLDNTGYGWIGDVGDLATGAGGYITFYGKDFVGDEGRVDIVSKDHTGAIRSAMTFGSYIQVQSYFNFLTAYAGFAGANNSLFMDNSNDLYWRKGGTNYKLASSGDIATHAALTTGVHGVGASTVASAADVALKVAKAGDTMTGDLTLTNKWIKVSTGYGIIANAAGGDVRLLGGTGLYTGGSLVASSDTAGYHPGSFDFLYGSHDYAALGAIINFRYLASGGDVDTFTIDKNGCLKIATCAAANAPNSSLYYSSTSAKLVWKDAGGTERALY